MNDCHCFTRYGRRGFIECAHVRHPDKGRFACVGGGLGETGSYVGWFVIFARWLFLSFFGRRLRLLTGGLASPSPIACKCFVVLKVCLRAAPELHRLLKLN